MAWSREITRAFVQSLSVVLLVSMGCPLALAQEDPIAKMILGVWKEKEGDHVYAFLDDYEFEYSFDNRSYADKEKKLGPKIVRQKGAWQTESDFCWVGQSKGNLMIHLGTDRCCFLAQMLGKNLILSSIGHGIGVCKDRVLVRDSTDKKANRQTK